MACSAFLHPSEAFRAPAVLDIVPHEPQDSGAVAETFIKYSLYSLEIMYK
jgi:hypothetical protein